MAARLKALDAYAAYLAARHADDQEAIAAQLAVGLFPLWKIMKFQELDASTVTWLHAAMPLVEKAFYQSQRVAAVFAQNVRFAALPTDKPLPIAVPDVENPHVLSPDAFDMPDLGTEDLVDILDEFDVEHVAQSLTTEANYKTKKQMPGPEEDLMHNALVRSSGEAVRQAVDGSRGAADSIVKYDRKALGYARVTDSDPCSFCAILASWGAVYQKNSFKASNAKFAANKSLRDLPDGWTDLARVHPNCRCTLRPVFTKSMDMDAAAKYWFKGWTDITSKNPYLSNKKQLALFDAWHREHPYPGTQFDLHALGGDLSDRRRALLDAGYSADSPQVKWAEQAKHNLAA